jgi:hypothetical protein
VHDWIKGLDCLQHHKIHSLYGMQFIKLLQYIVQDKNGFLERSIQLASKKATHTYGTNTTETNSTGRLLGLGRQSAAIENKSPFGLLRIPFRGKLEMPHQI